MGKLSGKFAVVTGAAQGIGAGVVKRFLEDGVDAVALVDLNLEAAEATAKELDPTGTRAFAFKCNVANPQDVERCFAEIIAKFGRVDILVNNAGIIRDRTIIKMPVEDWELVLKIDLSALFYCCKQVLPGMIERQYGKIVNMSSMGFMGSHGQSNYAAAKHGVVALSRVLAKEYAKYNITANAVCPAAVATDMITAVEPELLKKKMAAFPRCRPAEVAELAAVVSFLASDDSSFVNGERMIVTDGRMCL
ncbi:MAG: SDR family oxidoreductase [Oscillospiraceae bacterium]|nr:SDR family oxidoreductase [Oscillospiraceae bacterium]